MTKPLNILYLHERSGMAGAENSLRLIGKYLDRNSFHPLFVLPEDGPLAVELKNIGADVSFIPFPRLISGASFFKSLLKLKRFIKEKKIDIVHSNSIRTHLYGILSSRFTGTASVWHERNLLITENIDIERMLSSLPDAIICNSMAVARRFERHGKITSRIYIIHNGVDLTAFNPNVSGEDIRKKFSIKTNDIVIGISARLEANKDHETFFRAAEIVVKSMPDMASSIKFLVAGGPVFAEDMWYEEYLKKFIGGMSIKDKVIFTGICQDMPKVYAAMDMLVLASKVEACSRAISEAMATGKPVIATNIGGNPEMVIDGVTGMLVRSGDPYNMSDAIKTLVCDKTKRSFMGSEGRKVADERFDIRESVRKTGEVYLKLQDR